MEDSYTLTLQLAGGLTGGGLIFPYGIDADTTLVIENNVRINGNVLVRNGNLSIGNNGIIKGSVYLMGDPTGGNLSLGHGTVIERNVLAVGNVGPLNSGCKGYRTGQRDPGR